MPKEVSAGIIAYHQDPPGIPEGSWLEQAIWGYNGETITIQYCLPEENNIPIIWIGYPV